MRVRLVFFLVLFIVASTTLVAGSTAAFAAGRDVIVGKGSPTSKRVALTRFHGMANAPKLRLAAIRAKQKAALSR